MNRRYPFIPFDHPSAYLTLLWGGRRGTRPTAHDNPAHHPTHNPWGCMGGPNPHPMTPSLSPAPQPVTPQSIQPSMFPDNTHTHTDDDLVAVGPRTTITQRHCPLAPLNWHGPWTHDEHNEAGYEDEDKQKTWHIGRTGRDTHTHSYIHSIHHISATRLCAHHTVARPSPSHPPSTAPSSSTVTTHPLFHEYIQV